MGQAVSKVNSKPHLGFIRSKGLGLLSWDDGIILISGLSFSPGSAREKGKDLSLSSRLASPLPQDSSLASVTVGIIQVLFTAVAALIMDRAGRKLLLALSGEA